MLPNAKERLSRIAMVKPERARIVSVYIYIYIYIYIYFYFIYLFYSILFFVKLCFLMPRKGFLGLLW